MAIHHPSQHFIYYLLSRSLGNKSTDAAAVEVVSRLGELGLPVPQNEAQLRGFLAALATTRESMRPPPGFNPGAAKPSEGTLKFLRKWKIEEAWKGGLREVLELFERPEMRRTISVLLLGPLTRQAVSHLVRKHFGLRERELTTQTVQLYEHYFWNVSSLDVQGWRRMLSKDWYPGYVTDLLLALDATRDQAGALTAANAAFRQGAAMDPAHTYATMQHYGFRMFMETAAGSGPPLPRAQSAALAFNIFRVAVEELDRRRGGNTEVLAELRRIGAKYDNSPIRTVIDVPVEPKKVAMPAETPQHEEVPR